MNYMAHAVRSSAASMYRILNELPHNAVLCSAYFGMMCISVAVLGRSARLLGAAFRCFLSMMSSELALDCKSKPLFGSLQADD